MLPKINRLTKKIDFDSVFKGGKSVKNDFLIFKILENHLKNSRFGFIVSKKVSNRAVQRNKIKRWLRDLVSKQIKNSKNPIDGVFISLPAIKKKDFSEVQQAVENFFEKLK